METNHEQSIRTTETITEADPHTRLAGSPGVLALASATKTTG
jgi:hypothetical protein